jgi:hypothetical protein
MGACQCVAPITLPREGRRLNKIIVFSRAPTLTKNNNSVATTIATRLSTQPAMDPSHQRMTRLNRHTPVSWRSVIAEYVQCITVKSLSPRRPDRVRPLQLARITEACSGAIIQHGRRGFTAALRLLLCKPLTRVSIGPNGTLPPF